MATISLPERLLRTLCGVIAATLIAGTVLVVGLAVNLFGAPPAIPETADLPTRLLLQKPFEQSIWPVDMVASLLYAVALGAVILLAAVLYTAVDARRPLAVAPLAALGAGGILGAAAQLLYVGAKAPIIDIQYCDCGFKAEEVISQQWALILVQGAQSWLINGAVVLIAIGIAGAGIELASRIRGTIWRPLSFATSAALLLAVLVSTPNLQNDLAQVLQAVAAGIVLPAWVIWLGWNSALVRSVEPGRAPSQDTAIG